jgi:hypothetical protein
MNKPKSKATDKPKARPRKECKPAAGGSHVIKAPASASKTGDK